MSLNKASRLLKELKATKGLPFFNEELFKDSLRDMSSLLQEMQELYRENADGDELKKPEKAFYLMSLYTMILRLKRCLIVYLNTRIERIEEDLWYMGGAVTTETRECSTQDEQNYIKEYKGLLDRYSDALPIHLDLLKDLDPPKDLFIEIRVINDCGEIMMPDGGSVNLVKNTTHLLKKSDVEHLIRQGHLVCTGN